MGDAVYEPKKEIMNECPECGDRAIFKLRYPRDDEGHMMCHRCQEKKKEKDAENERCGRVSSASDVLANVLYEAGVNQYESITAAIEELIEAKIAMELCK